MMGARGGAEVMNVMANCLVGITERLGKMEEAGHMPGIRTETPDPPLTQRGVEKRRFQGHARQRIQPR